MRVLVGFGEGDPSTCVDYLMMSPDLEWDLGIWSTVVSEMYCDIHTIIKHPIENTKTILMFKAGMSRIQHI